MPRVKPTASDGDSTASLTGSRMAFWGSSKVMIFMLLPGFFLRSSLLERSVCREDRMEDGTVALVEVII